MRFFPQICGLNLVTLSDLRRILGKEKMSWRSRSTWSSSHMRLFFLVIWSKKSRNPSCKVWPSRTMWWHFVAPKAMNHPSICYICWVNLWRWGDPLVFFISFRISMNHVSTEARLGTTTRRDLGTTTRSPSARRTSRRRAGANIWETLSLVFSEFCFCEDLEKVSDSGEMDRTKERFWINQSSEKKRWMTTPHWSISSGTEPDFLPSNLHMKIKQCWWLEPPMEMYIKNPLKPTTSRRCIYTRSLVNSLAASPEISLNQQHETAARSLHDAAFLKHYGLPLRRTAMVDLVGFVCCPTKIDSGKLT